jgi:Tol biopolymer transport system component
MRLMMSMLAVLLASAGPGPALAQDTQRVSVAVDGAQGTLDSGAVMAVSASGRFVAFESNSPNLVAADGNGFSDVFLRDTCLGAPAGCAPVTELVSLQPNGTQFTLGASQPAISADGRFVAFTAGTAGTPTRQVWRRDTCAGTPAGACIPSTTLVSAILIMPGLGGNGDSRKAAISASGRFVAFLSFATDLVANDTNSVGDIFVRDVDTGTTTRVSVASNGTEANRGNPLFEEVSAPAISGDGRFVAFASDANNLVAGDTNNTRDLFVRDTCVGAAACAPSTIRVSVASDGTQASVEAGNNDAFSISGDGRFVAFRSLATNLVAGDTNGVGDAFVRDTCVGAGGPCVPSTARVSLTSAGAQIVNNGSFTPSLGSTGRFIAFVSAAAGVVPGDTNNTNDVFVRDTCLGAPAPCAPSTVRASLGAGGTQGNGSSAFPKISGDGRFVAFQSIASNLVAGDSNGLADIFLSPVPAPPNQAPVAAAGAAQTVAEGALVTLDGTASSDPDGQPLSFAWTQTGGPVVALGGAATATPSFVAPELAGGTPLVLTFQLVVSDGAAASPAASVQVTVTSTVRLVRPLAGGLGGASANGAALNPSVSADGRFVVFESTSTNLVVSGCTNGVAHIFLRDRVTGTLVCVSVGPTGAPGNGPSTRPAISADGRFVAFLSAAGNLTPGACGGLVVHVYLRDLVAGTTTCVSIATGGAAANGSSDAPALSGDGALVVFVSLATNLGGCAGGGAQVYLHDRATGATTCLSLAAGGIQGDGPSGAPAISADGRVVAFESAAGNLVVGCAGALQILVFDRPSGTLGCASVDAGGTPGAANSHAPVLNADGTVLAFASLANLAAPCDNGILQIFVRKLSLGQTQCITVGPDGTPGNRPSDLPAISADGRTVVFITQATNLTGPGVLAASLGGPVAQPAGAADAVRWRDSAAVRDPMTVLLSGGAGATGDRAAAMSGDGSLVITEVQGGGAGGPGVAAVEEAPEPPVGQPLIVAPAPGTVFTLLGAIPFTLQWTPVQNAAGYRLAFSGAAAVALDQPGPATTFTVTLTPTIAPGGAYQVQVIPLGADGAPGSPSAAVAFSLVQGIAPAAGDRPFFTTPGAEVTVARGQSLTFAWTALAGVASYGVEFTGADLVFANPNGTAPDGVNGFGGAGGGFLVGSTSVTVAVPEVAPGRYQVRVIGLSAAIVPVGSFSDAVTVVVQ